MPKPNPHVSPNYNFPLRGGLLVVSTVALLSLVLSAGLLAYVSWLVYKGKRQHLQPLSVLFLFAILFDMMQAFANVLCARWAFKGRVEEGAYCTAQAVLKQFGNDGTAWFTIAIAILTYIQVLSGLRVVQGTRGDNPVSWISAIKPWTFAFFAICFIFTFLLLMIVIPATTIHPYYGNTGLWCWIVDTSPENGRLRIGSEYLFMWLAVIISSILYFMIWRKASKVKNDIPASEHQKIDNLARSVRWYPIAYLIVIAPQSVVRFLQFQSARKSPSEGWDLLTTTFFSSGGTLNVILWTWTGRRFGIWEPGSEGNRGDNNSGGDVSAQEKGQRPRSGDTDITNERV